MHNNSWSILLIDDEAGIRKVMTIALIDAGYTVFTAPDGENGLAECNDKSPQIIITDIRMPGMDGLQVLQKIKALHPEMEVIVVTGYGDMDMAIRALQFGASDFITKPIEDEALIIALERAKERYISRKKLNDYASLMEERWMDTSEELAKIFIFQKNLIESSIDGIIGCDKKGTIITFNKSMERMLGYAKEETLNTLNINDLFLPSDTVQFWNELASENYGGQGKLIFIEKVLISKTGETIPTQLSATVLFEEGIEAGMVMTFRDLREMKRLEQQFSDQARLLQQDKMISLGRLSASVVHEINNPLTGILDHVRLMAKILNSSDPDQKQLQKFRHYLTIIEEELDGCSKIVSNLLVFSQKAL